MGIFGDSSSTFPRDSQGRFVITTRLPRKRAYIIPPERAAAYLRFLRFYLLGYFIVIPFASAVVFPYGLVSLTLVYIAGLFVVNRHFTRKLEPTSEIPARISQTEALKRDAPELLTLAVVIIAIMAGTPLLLRLPRTLRVLIPATLYIGILWLVFGSPRKSKGQLPPVSSG